MNKKHTVLCLISVLFSVGYIRAPHAIPELRAIGTTLMIVGVVEFVFGIIQNKKP